MMWLKEYGWIILVVVGFAIYEIVKYNKIKNTKGVAEAKEEILKDLREKSYALMLLAEKVWGQDKDGQFKFDWVIQNIYKLLPETLTGILDETTLRDKVQEFYDQAKDMLDNGKLDNSVNK